MNRFFVNAIKFNRNTAAGGGVKVGVEIVQMEGKLPWSCRKSNIALSLIFMNQASWCCCFRLKLSSPKGKWVENFSEDVK